jgi:hypothetical protein
MITGRLRPTTVKSAADGCDERHVTDHPACRRGNLRLFGKFADCCVRFSGSAKYLAFTHFPLRPSRHPGRRFLGTAGLNETSSACDQG